MDFKIAGHNFEKLVDFFFKINMHGNIKRVFHGKKYTLQNMDNDARR